MIIMDDRRYVSKQVSKALYFAPLLLWTMHMTKSQRLFTMFPTPVKVHQHGMVVDDIWKAPNIIITKNISGSLLLL